MFQVVLFVSLSAVASLLTQICREFESETISEIQKKCSNANTTLQYCKHDKSQQK